MFTAQCQAAEKKCSNEVIFIEILKYWRQSIMLSEWLLKNKSEDSQMDNYKSNKTETSHEQVDVLGMTHSTFWSATSMLHLLYQLIGSAIQY